MKMYHARGKPSQDTASVDVNIVEDERNKFPRESALDTSWKMYDESSESVLDASMGIFDDGNDSVKRSFNKVENLSTDKNQMKETVVGVRGTKRKRTDVSSTKDGKYQCQECDYETRWSHALRTHVESKHEGVRYPCDQCDYKATQESNLKKHKKYKHEGVQYPCDQCDYKATQEIHLKRHKEYKHEGVRYPCDKCDYKAIREGQLKIHKESKHQGVCYSCDDCQYKAPYGYITILH